MRSTSASTMVEKSNSRPVDEGSLTRMPSTSTSVWRTSPPRKDTVWIWPGPPFWVTVTPGDWRRRSATSRALDFAISSAEMTVIALPSRWIGWGVRVAVTTTSGFSCGGCWARLGRVASVADARRLAARRRRRGRLVMIPPSAPPAEWLRVQHMTLAGLLARGSGRRSTFPAPLGGPVVPWIAARRLQLRGQPRFRTGFPFHPFVKKGHQRRGHGRSRVPGPQRAAPPAGTRVVPRGVPATGRLAANHAKAPRRLAPASCARARPGRRAPARRVAQPLRRPAPPRARRPATQIASVTFLARDPELSFLAAEAGLGPVQRRQRRGDPARRGRSRPGRRL